MFTTAEKGNSGLRRLEMVVQNNSDKIHQDSLHCRKVDADFSYFAISALLAMSLDSKQQIHTLG